MRSSWTASFHVVAAFNAHDADAFVAVMTEDVVFTVPHLHPCMDAPR
jgi:ketosteroid isomerase-like protein